MSKELTSLEWLNYYKNKLQSSSQTFRPNGFDIIETELKRLETLEEEKTIFDEYGNYKFNTDYQQKGVNTISTINLNKELTPLQALKELRSFCGDVYYSEIYDKDYKLIETELKENSELRTRNYELLKESERFYNQRNEYKRALEIIKELFDFDFAIRFGDNQPMIRITNKRNGQYWELPETTEICVLLKEVLL